MDCINPVIDTVSRLWDCCTAIHRTNFCKLEENLNCLKTSLERLKNLRDDVKVKVDVETDPTTSMKCTNMVDGWLMRVEDVEHEVDEIFQDYSPGQNNESSALKNIAAGCFCCFRPKNCWTGYKFGELVAEKLADVEKLISEGDFDVVVAKFQPAILVQEMPINQVEGMDQKFDEIWKLVTEENQIRIIGLCGMGGVGKTTLLKKLNNGFLKSDNHNFDVVVWVVVSKDLNLENVQNQIGDSLGLSWAQKERDVNRRARDILNVLSKKKFVVLLDDIWERVDLQSIGIPSLDETCSSQGIKSKVVFTTRSEDVCGFMDADKKITVECLNWDESWSLFKKKVGREALNRHPKIPKLAKNVARECGGLPLALIVIGRTMASKRTPQEWEHAMTVLCRSASEFSGMDNEVLLKLKFSYDNLRNDKIRNCFLYCSLYPEDFHIRKEELIDLWIAEGFLTDFNDIKEALNEGHDVIGCLLSHCLLESVFDDEETEVKMHDVVRDMAIWVASGCGRKKGNFLVVQPSNKPKLDEWEKAVRISLISNATEELSEAPSCFNLSTLLLQHSSIHTISDNFFQLMPLLKVINMSSLLYVEKMPTSITSLVELEYLNLSQTIIGCYMPGWLKSLVKLKYLNLSEIFDSLYITPGEIAGLSKLQMLDSYRSSLNNWEVDGGPSLRELEGLKYLGISIATFHALKRFLSSHRLQFCTRRLYISNIPDWPSIISLALSSYLPSPPSLSLATMINLKELYLEDCPKLEELRIRWVAEDEEKITLLKVLERLKLRRMPNLKIVWDIVPQPRQFYFTNLQDVDIYDCDALKDVTWLIYAQGLRTLCLASLDGLEEIISDGFAVDEKFNTFSRLKLLHMSALPKLKNICLCPVSFPSLEVVRVLECPKLKKLPLDTNTANNKILKRIEGEIEWWESLEWEDEIVMSAFVPYFIDLGLL